MPFFAVFLLFLGEYGWMGIIGENLLYSTDTCRCIVRWPPLPQQNIEVMCVWKVMLLKDRLELEGLNFKLKSLVIEEIFSSFSVLAAQNLKIR